MRPRQDLSVAFLARPLVGKNPRAGRNRHRGVRRRKRVSPERLRDFALIECGHLRRGTLTLSSCDLNPARLQGFRDLALEFHGQ